jgi:glycerol uptake facilitator-like aquaporin
MNMLVISISLGVCVTLAYPISGGCLNPAIGTSISFVDFIDTNGSKEAIEYIWVYAAMPFVGAILASIFYECCFK